MLDEKYVIYINTYIEDLKAQTENMKDKGLCWDFIKCKIREYLIQFSKEKKEKKLSTKQSLLVQLRNWKENLFDGQCEDLLLLEANKAELEFIE